jgi:cephalosporin-C deacetylase-like acetyl esterase
MNTLISICLASVLISADDAELRVLTPESGITSPSDVLPEYLKGLAREAFQKRRDRYEQLKSPEQCREFAKSMREFFLRQIGPLPEKQPLNPQVVGKIDAEGYHIEKIIYESRPGHHVTAILYLPNGTPPFPGVLVACGHSANGKAADYNQRMSILLAKHGMAALCYDPIGQGERSQLLTPDRKPKYGSTDEHTMVGIGAIPLGWSTATFRIYDGMRSIDYLASRPEVDPNRIGCTGCSGGGTMTSYLMALDERIACAAPACFLTTQQRLIETLGPQDAEQNIAGQIGFGMEQTDYVLMRAPKPTLICSTTRDFFDIQGSWDTFRQAKRFYGRLGFPERVDLVEDDAEHGVTRMNRGTLTHWMQRWMLAKDEHVEEPDFPLFTDEQLTCTPQGQVMLLDGEKSVFDFSAARADLLKQQRSEYWSKTSPDEARNAIRALAAIGKLDELRPIESQSVGTVQRDGMKIEKLVLKPESHLPVAALLFTPAGAARDAVLYVAGDGIQQDAKVDGPIARLVADGHTVLAVDLPGIGETRIAPHALFGDWTNAFLAYLLGKPLVAMRAENILQCARFLASRNAPDKPRPVLLVATGACGVAALHAAALEPQLFNAAMIQGSVSSWDQIVHTPETKNQLVNVVHNALTRYDLPDLIQLAGADKVTVVEPCDATGQPAK